MTRMPAGFLVVHPGSAIVQPTLGEAVSRGKVFARNGRPLIVYELVEVYRIEPTDTGNVPPAGGVA